MTPLCSTLRRILIARQAHLPALRTVFVAAFPVFAGQGPAVVSIATPANTWSTMRRCVHRGRKFSSAIDLHHIGSLASSQIRAQPSSDQCRCSLPSTRHSASARVTSGSSHAAGDSDLYALPNQPRTDAYLGRFPRCRGVSEGELLMRHGALPDGHCERDVDRPAIAAGTRAVRSLWPTTPAAFEHVLSARPLKSLSRRAHCRTLIPAAPARASPAAQPLPSVDRTSSSPLQPGVHSTKTQPSMDGANDERGERRERSGGRVWYSVGMTDPCYLSCTR